MGFEIFIFLLIRLLLERVANYRNPRKVMMGSITESDENLVLGGHKYPHHQLEHSTPNPQSPVKRPALTQWK